MVDIKICTSSGALFTKVWRFLKISVKKVVNKFKQLKMILKFEKRPTAPNTMEIPICYSVQQSMAHSHSGRDRLVQLRDKRICYCIWSVMNRFSLVFGFLFSHFPFHFALSFFVLFFSLFTFLCSINLFLSSLFFLLYFFPYLILLKNV